MKRRRLTVLGAFFMLLCLLTAYVWIRSYFMADDWFVIYQIDGSERVSTLSGQIMIRHDRAPDGKYGGVRRFSHRSDRITSLPPRPWDENLLQTRWLLFRYVNIEPIKPRPLPANNPIRQAIVSLRQKPQLTRDERAILSQLQIQLMQMAQQSQMVGESYWEIVFPLWLPPSIFLAPALVIWIATRLRRRHRKRHGLCPVCGYDLRASPATCPECGTASLQNPSQSVAVASHSPSGSKVAL